MSDDFKVGDSVVCTEHYSSHLDHNIEEGVTYTVTESAQGKESGININNKCHRNGENDRCECQRPNKPYWAERCFTIVAKPITPEDVKLAKPLPSVEDAAAFFGMRTP
jgi:hypothetical protein